VWRRGGQKWTGNGSPLMLAMVCILKISIFCVFLLRSIFYWDKTFSELIWSYLTLIWMISNEKCSHFHLDVYLGNKTNWSIFSWIIWLKFIEQIHTFLLISKNTLNTQFKMSYRLKSTLVMAAGTCNLTTFMLFLIFSCVNETTYYWFSLVILWHCLWWQKNTI